MGKELNYNEVIQFVQEFGIDFISHAGELIIDKKTNTYVGITNCKRIEEVKVYVVFALCRPIGKGLGKKDAERLLAKLNKYFKTNLERDDLLLMYGELCYTSKLDEFKSFIQRGFPIEELKEQAK